MATASSGYFAISKETTPGTAITTPTKFYPVEEVDFPWENEFQDIRLIAGSRQAYDSFDGAIRPTGTHRGPLYPSGASGLIFYGLMGAKADAAESTSVTAKRHSFTAGATLPSFTLERADARSGEGGLLCERMAGCKVESVRLNCAFGEKVDFEVSYQATKKPTVETAVVAGAITYPVEKPLIFKGASVEIDDVVNSHFKSVSIEINNELARQEALNGSQESYKMFEGGQMCNVSGTMVFEDLTMYNRLVNGTEFKLDVLLVSATIADATPTPDVYYRLDLSFDICRVARYSLPFRAGEVIEADVDLKVLFDPVDKRTFTLQTVNLDDTTDYDA